MREPAFSDHARRPQLWSQGRELTRQVQVQMHVTHRLGQAAQSKAGITFRRTQGRWFTQGFDPALRHLGTAGTAGAALAAEW